MNALNVCVNLYATSLWKRELSHKKIHLHRYSELQWVPTTSMSVLDNISRGNPPKLHLSDLSHNLSLRCFSAARQMTKGWDLRSNFSLQASLNVRTPGEKTTRLLWLPCWLAKRPSFSMNRMETKKNSAAWVCWRLCLFSHIFALIGPPFGVITYSEYVCFLLMAPSAHPRQRWIPVFTERAETGDAKEGSGEQWN